jgi:hypothetical protein
MSEGKTRLLNLAGEKSSAHVAHDFSAVPLLAVPSSAPQGHCLAHLQRRARAASTVEAVSVIAVTDNVVRRKHEIHRGYERRCFPHIEVDRTYRCPHLQSR